MIAKRIFAMFLAVLLVTCSSTVPSNRAVPTPDSTCQTVLDWKGIVPGQSTKRDVIRILGKPLHRGSEQYVDGRVSFYAYQVESGAISSFVEDRVFFGKKGVVAWIEVFVADRDGQIHKLQEMVDQLGTTLDQVYVNNDFRQLDQYDIHAGPDQIYVWADCGLAIGASSLTTDSLLVGTDLKVRHPVSPDDPFQPKPNTNDAVLFKFFYPKTSFAGFEEFYKDKVPFLFYYIWKEYGASIR